MSRFKLVIRQKKGLTLIELISAMLITALIGGVVVFTLKTALDIYQHVHETIMIEKVSNGLLEELVNGTYKKYGIKDCLEIVQASTTGISFVPLWVDDNHLIASFQKETQKFYLRQPFKPGSSTPIAEVYVEDRDQGHWQSLPVNFYFDEKREGGKAKDMVTFISKPEEGKKLRFIYHPDESLCQGCVMHLQYENERILRTYKDESDTMPRYKEKDIFVKKLLFQYFDNTNTEIIPAQEGGSLTREEISLISAIRISVLVSYKGISKENSLFVNLRNKSITNTGIIIRAGTKFFIPNSKEIQALTLFNIIGAKSGGLISLDARSSKGKSWRFNAELGYKDGKQIIQSYTVEYPIGYSVLKRNVEYSTDIPLSLLSLDTLGQYDYDVEEEGHSVVNLEGEVELTVRQMDAAGAALLIRP